MTKRAEVRKQLHELRYWYEQAGKADGVESYKRRRGKAGLAEQHIITLFDEAEVELEKLREWKAKAAALLRQVERTNLTCPWCYYHDSGHSEDCELAELLELER